MRRNVKLAFILLAFPPFLFAQSGADTLGFLKSNYSSPLLGSSFDKQLNTFGSNTLFRFGQQKGKFFYGINENYNTTLTRSSINHFRDEQNFNALLEYNLLRFLSFGVLLNSNIYSDDRKLNINTASEHNASLFTKFNWQNKVSLTPFGGYSLNGQIGEKDKGFIYGAELKAEPTKLKIASLSAVGKYLNQEIAPRKNETRMLTAKLESRLNSYSINTLTGGYSRKRKDFYLITDSLTRQYFGITHNIQTRNESKYFLTEKFSYTDPTTKLGFNFNGGIFLRDIDRSTRYIMTENISSSSFDSDIKELKLNFAGSIRYSGKSLDGFIRINYAERDETHRAKPIEGANQIFFDEREKLEKQKNNKSQRVSLFGSLNFRLSRKDKIALTLLHRKLRYDTPSEENYDDRDELLSILRFRYSRIFSNYFLYFLELEGSINHVVYIFSERSSNNNIQRFIRLASGGEFSAAGFSNKTSPRFLPITPPTISKI